MEQTVVTLELRELLHDNLIKRKVLPFFNTFDSGNLDDDIQVFLNKHALNYEKSGIARTTLIFNAQRTELLGYFTIGLNTIKFSRTIKKFSKYKKVEDAYPGIDILHNGMSPVYKLFMIGKNYGAKSDTKGFMDYCFNGEGLIWDRIYSCNKFVGTSLMYLDCEDNESLVNKYQSLGFEVYDKYEYVEKGTGNKIRMVKMITKI